MKKLLFIVSLLIAFVFDAKCQNADVPPNAEPGKCYAKCIKPESTPQNIVWTNWEEVVCGSDITPRLISDVVNALKNKGYKVDTSATVMNADIKAELTKFQKTFELPVGNLNLKTLAALGVSY